MTDDDVSELNDMSFLQTVGYSFFNCILCKLRFKKIFATVSGKNTKNTYKAYKIHHNKSTQSHVQHIYFIVMTENHCVKHPSSDHDRPSGGNNVKKKKKRGGHLSRHVAVHAVNTQNS